jgi:hypothetical protein
MLGESSDGRRVRAHSCLWLAPTNFSHFLGIPRLGFIELIRFDSSWAIAAEDTNVWILNKLAKFASLHPLREVYLHGSSSLIQLADLRAKHPNVLFINSNGVTSESAAVVALDDWIARNFKPAFSPRSI